MTLARVEQPPVVVDVLVQLASGMGVAGFGSRCLACTHVDQPRRRKEPLTKKQRDEDRGAAIERAVAHARQAHEGHDGWRLGADVVLPYR